MIEYIEVINGVLKRGKGSKFKKPKKNTFLFLFVRNPSRDEIHKLSKDFNLSRDLFERYKTAPYARSLSVSPFAFVMKDYFYDKGKIQTAKLLFININNTLIISSNKDSKYYRELFEDTYTEVKQRKVKSIGHILYHFLLEDVEDNYIVLDKTEEQIGELESKVVKKTTNRQSQEVIALKKDLFKISRQFWASTKIINSIRNESSTVRIDEESKKKLEDVYETFLHQIEVANSQKEVLSDILTMYSTNVSNNLTSTGNTLNIIMKKLAAFAFIVMIPTLITGYYGMNISNLPFANHQNSSGMVTLILLLSILPPIYFFIKKKWI